MNFFVSSLVESGIEISPFSVFFEDFPSRRIINWLLTDVSLRSTSEFMSSVRSTHLVSRIPGVSEIIGGIEIRGGMNSVTGFVESMSSHSSSSQVKVQVVFNSGGDPVGVFGQYVLFVIARWDQTSLRGSVHGGFKLASTGFDGFSE